MFTDFFISSSANKTDVFMYVDYTYALIKMNTEVAYIAIEYERKTEQ